MCKGELARFLLRAEALKLYRQCCRTIQGAPTGSRGAVACAGLAAWASYAIDTRLNTRHNLAAELRAHARNAFELQRNKLEAYDIKYALSDGREQLKRLKETLMMQQ